MKILGKDHAYGTQRIERIINNTGFSSQCLLTQESERYTIYRKNNALTPLSMKQMYSRYAHIAFRETLHVSRPS